jgi:hypothetical protein
MDPIERSSPPELRISVVPMASTPMVDVANRILRKLLTDRK